MTSEVIKRLLARQDLVDQFEYLAENSLEVADRFLEAAELTFGFLATHPHVGDRVLPTRPALAELRRWQIHGFPNLLVFFRPYADGVEIVRVLHAARDWQTILGS